MQELTINVALTGEPGVGKTSIRNALANKPFNTKHSPTIGIEFNSIQVNAGKTKLTLCDLSGDKSYETIRGNFYNRCSIFCIVVDATHSAEKQIATINRFKEEIKNSVGDSAKEILVIANKKTAKAYLLNSNELVTAGMTPDRYVAVSAKEITENIEARKILVTKLAEVALRTTQQQASQSEPIMVRDERQPLLKQKPSHRSRFLRFFCCCRTSDADKTNAHVSEQDSYERARPL